MKMNKKNIIKKKIVMLIELSLKIHRERLTSACD
jgi:hypothetical protein